MVDEHTPKSGELEAAIGPASQVSRNEAIVFTDLDDAIVMMDVDEGQYYELDAIAARIWALLDTGRSITDLCDTLVAEFAVDPDTCHHDVLEFLQAASSMRLVDVQSAQTTPA